MSRRDEFLAGDRPDDVALYLAEGTADDLDPLVEQPYGEAVEGGAVLVVDGEDGRSVLAQLTGEDAMAFARRAGDRDGTVARDLTGGECPDEGDGAVHAVQFVFAFAEAQNEDAGGLYAEGDVVHAYARCACGASYADRWVVE